MELDLIYMEKALYLAKKSAEIGEVPVGAVIVDKNGKIVGEGMNLRETKKSPLAHAEIMAINQAARRLGGWRLVNCTLYVTLEPCIMCMGAIINARIERVVYGAKDKNGAINGPVDLSNLKGQFKPECIGGVMEDDCKDVLTDFFEILRQNNI